MILVPYFHQWDAEHVPNAGPTACFRACRAMAAAVGTVIPESTLQRIQVAVGETADGGVVVDAAGLREALIAISAELSVGRPVVFGVNYKAGSTNRDGITDHFVLCVGRMPFLDDAEVWAVLDPGLRSTPLREYPGGGEAPQLRWNSEWQVDPESGNLVRSSPTWPRMELSMVVEQGCTT